MKVVVQRSGNAKCVVDGKVTGSIENGLMILVGFTEGDDLEKIDYLCKKIVNLRIFDDESGIMNKSILDVGGSILSISQFTLYADTSKGNRPSYIKALGGNEAIKLYEAFNQRLSEYVKVETGIFGADMQITFTNSGPVTIIMER